MDQIFAELWAVVLKQGPLGALLLFILYIVNAERKAFREKTDQLNEEIRERLLKALNDTAAAMKDLGGLIERVREVLEELSRRTPK